MEKINLSWFQRCTLRYLCHTFSSILYHLRLLFPCFNITLALFHWKKWNHWEEKFYLHLPPKLSNLSETVLCLPSYDNGSLFSVFLKAKISTCGLYPFPSLSSLQNLSLLSTSSISMLLFFWIIFINKYLALISPNFKTLLWLWTPSN